VALSDLHAKAIANQDERVAASQRAQEATAELSTVTASVRALMTVCWSAVRGMLRWLLA
jgi:hypothetical protein